jgi:hypothetical protein
MAATFALKVVCDPARELSLFQSILLSLGQSINHENAVDGGNYEAEAEESCKSSETINSKGTISIQSKT